MSLLAVGINHKTASVQLREKLAFSPDEIEKALQSLAKHSQTSEAVILSTCNRTEIYANGTDFATLLDWLESFHAIPKAEIEPCLYHHEQLEAVNHLMRVSCGLDSLVLGEPQILGQLKQAFNASKQAGTINRTIDRLFQRTFSVAKKVRTETEIGSQAVSVAFAAVSLAKQIFSELSQARVLLIGAGETIELVAKHLSEQAVTHITVANRTVARAQEMASQFNAAAISLPAIPEYLTDTDIVISSTASPLPILGKGMVESALAKRRHKPMLLIDIAVPRDIEEQVNELDDAFLYTVDDLQDIVQQNMASRQEAAKQAESITIVQAGEFMQWIESSKNIDTVKEFREKSELIKQELTQKALNRINEGADSGQVLIELANKLTNRLIHAPTSAMVEASRQGDWQALNTLRRQLGLDKD